MDWNTAEDKMWNGIGWYGFIGPTTSTTDISLVGIVHCIYNKRSRVKIKKKNNAWPKKSRSFNNK